MINEIEMYNVGFGDCIICNDGENKSKLLVDCGGKQNFSKEIVKELNASLKRSQQNYLMLTHFHSDHFNGLKNLDGSLRFNCIYLPNFLTENILRLEFASIARSLKNYKNAEYYAALNLLTCVPNLFRFFANGAKVVFLNKTYGFEEMSPQRCPLGLRVLWPDMSYMEQTAKSINALLNQEFSDESKAVLDEYVRHYYRTLMQRTDNGVLYSQNSNGEDLLDRIYECANINLNISKKLIDKLSKFQNKISLCFDNAIGRNTKPVLFLSDVTQSGYRQIEKINDLSPHYSAIKVPHHGTKDYFIDNLPPSDMLLITNDGSWKRCRICDEYYYAYPNALLLFNSNFLKAGGCGKIIEL